MKRILVSLANLFLVATFFFPNFASAQSKHPRAIELENHLTKAASDFLRGRFPSSPFTVVVNVDPLHRYEDRRQANTDQEVLPYMPTDNPDLVDEWDDPAMGLAGLVLRAKRVMVSVSVPLTVKEDEIAEIEQSLMSIMNLVPARDQIKIQKREWGQIQTTSWAQYWQAGMILTSVLILLLGGFFILRSSSSSFAQALAEKNQNSPASPIAMPNMINTQNTQPIGNSNARGSGDLKYNDPLKIREVVLNGIRYLNVGDGFPSLQDMIMLDRLGDENPETLGSLLIELPVQTQKLVFGFSYQKHWLKAFNNPGDLNDKTLSLVQKLMRVQRSKADDQLQKLLISFWRLGKKRAEFLRSIDMDQALAILGYLPKQISVESAKQAFPGNWGTVLEFETARKTLSPETILLLTEKAQKIVPLRDFTGIDHYRQISDLLEYLRHASPQDEKDVYLTIKSESMLPEIRPPFYSVLEIDPVQAMQFVPMVSLDDWAYVLFNLPRDSRRVIESRFNEKQQFLLKEKLKNFDAHNPDPSEVGSRRERIAMIFRDFQAQVQTPAPTEDTTNDENAETQKAA